MSTVITSKNFKSQLNALVKSTTAQRDKLQALIEFGLEHYKNTADTTYLTMAMNAVIGVRAFRTQTLKNYITAHANVSWSKAKDGKTAFKKLGGKDVEASVKELVGFWYEFDNNGNATPDLDVVMRAKSMIKALTKDGVKIKDGQEELARILADKVQEAMDEFAKAALKAKA